MSHACDKRGTLHVGKYENVWIKSETFFLPPRIDNYFPENVAHGALSNEQNCFATKNPGSQNFVKTFSNLFPRVIAYTWMQSSVLMEINFELRYTHALSTARAPAKIETPTFAAHKMKWNKIKIKQIKSICVERF